MTVIYPMSARQPTNSATITTLGGIQLATGAGYIWCVPACKVAGSTDCVGTLYNGTGTTGTPLAVFSLAKVGPIAMPNAAFSSGLYLNIVGTTMGAIQIEYTGRAAA